MSHQPKPGMRRVPRAALAVAVGLAAALATVPAVGQTIEELTNKNQQLEQMLMNLMQEVQTLKQQVKQASTDSAAAKEAAEAAAAAIPAPETTVTSGKPQVALIISGQVNRGVLYANDGQDDEFYHVDNDNSSTRVRFEGKGQFNEDLSIGTMIEVQMESNSSANVSQLGDRGANGADFLSERKLELYFDSERFGKLSIGQGDTASNGTAEADLSGTALVNYSAVEDSAGGLLFRRVDLPAGVTGVSPSSPTVGAAFNNLDGLSRDDRVRYDTPKYYGFGLSGSAIADGRYDVAARFGGEFADMFQVETAMAFANTADAANTVDGSASALHTPTGISLTYAAGVSTALTTAAPARNDVNYWYAKLGWQWPIFSIGKTYWAFDYTEGTDTSANGDFSQAYGSALVQKIDSISTELYVGYHGYSYDRVNANYDPIHAVLTGARIKF